MSALVLACLLLAGVAQAAFMIPGAPIRPKDFTLLKKDGVYHLFYIRNNVSLPAAENERDFGHSISTDLYHWSHLPPVMRVDTLGWDNVNVWAPHILERDGIWYMFYTGVQNEPGVYNNTQRTGLAVSTDLVNWTRQGPIFDNSQAPWAWWNPTKSPPASRDPFVMPDPTRPGMWLMYYTASPLSDSSVTQIGVAQSAGDFTQWDDYKPLLITNAFYTYNTLTESPHVFEHNGLWYLVITTNAGQPLTLYTSATDPAGDVPAWIYRGRLRNMLGYDTNSWFASEYFRDGTHDLFCFVQGDRIEIRKILWGTSWAFSLVQPPLFHVVTMKWAEPEAVAGTVSRLTFQVANPYNGLPSLETWVLDSLGNETQAPAESLGFFTRPSFTSDSADFYWSAKRWPSVPDSDTVTVTRLRIRTSDRTAESDVLTIRAAAWVAPDTTLPGDPPSGDGGGGVGADDDLREWLADRKVLRPLSGSPLGPGPALAITLTKSADVRLDLFDLSGRRVRNLANRRLPSGLTVLPWDGRGDDGGKQPRGVYFARFVSGSRVVTARVLWLNR